MRLNVPDDPNIHKTFFSQQTKRYVVPKKNDPKKKIFHNFIKILSKKSTGSLLTRAIIARRQKEDRVATAIFAWKHLTAAKCFHSWKSLHFQLSREKGSDGGEKGGGGRGGGRGRGGQSSSSSSSRKGKSNSTTTTSNAGSRGSSSSSSSVTMAAPSFPRRQMSTQVLETLGGKTGLRNLGNTW